MKATFVEPNPAEHEWITHQIHSAQLMVDAYSPSDAGQPLTLAALDRAFAGFLSTQESDEKVVNGVINCIGIAFGQFLVDGAGMSWVIATDQHGTDLAVRALPGAGDVLTYPANLIAKRWERKESHFIETTYQAIVSQIESIRQNPTAVKSVQPWWKFW